MFYAAYMWLQSNKAMWGSVPQVTECSKHVPEGLQIKQHGQSRTGSDGHLIGRD